MSKPLRLLMVEDSENDALLVVHEFRRADYQVMYGRVDTAEAMTAELASQTWDLVIADYTMPRFSGNAALELFKKSGFDVPFIFVSGTMGEDTAVAAMKAGAHDYIIKGNLTRLVPAVERELREAEMRREKKWLEQTRETLYQSSLQIQEPFALQERLERILQMAQGILCLDRLDILLADSEGRWLKSLESFGAEEALAALPVGIGPEGGAIAQAYLTRQPVVSVGQGPGELVLKPPYGRVEALRSHVFANFPLIVHGRVIGVLRVEWKQGLRPLDEATLKLLQLFATHAALAIEHARFYDRLEAKVSQRTWQLQIANAELEKAMHQAEAALRAKSDVLTKISNELRTPLDSIVALCRLLEDPTRGPLNDTQQRHVRNISANGERVIELLNDALDLSKVETQKLTLQPEPLSLPDALAAGLSEIRAQADAKRLKLALNVEARAATLVADPTRFRQILYNLLSNAVKFTPDGGQVTVTAHQIEDGFVDITVADTGIGIKEEQFRKLFQPSIQIEPASTTYIPGTGLGLALTRHLVELHGGTVWAYSKGEGRGSTFRFTLPLGGPAT